MSEKEIDQDWSSIHHTMVTVDHVNKIEMHVAERGEGNKEVVLFLHGFPDLWYCWRHQIVTLSDLGYRAVAPDLRGYGDTIITNEKKRKDINSYTIFQIVGDIITLMDEYLHVEKVYLVGHDWGAIIGWYLCMFRPERIQVYICLSVPFRPFLGRDPQKTFVQYFKDNYGEDFYLCRFQKPHDMEKELDHIPYDIKTLMTSILTSHSKGPAVFPQGHYWPGFNPDFDVNNPLTSWFTNKDAELYAAKFTKSGFTGPLNYYRALDLDWELTAPWTNVGVDKVPVKFITGNKGLLFTLAETQNYIFNGDFKKDVPSLESVKVVEGAGHFGLPQEEPEAVSNHILVFIQEHKM